jgi:hypothetical protein
VVDHVVQHERSHDRHARHGEDGAPGLAQAPPREELRFRRSGKRLAPLRDVVIEDAKRGGLRLEPGWRVRRGVNRVQVEGRLLHDDDRPPGQLRQVQTEIAQRP